MSLGSFLFGNKDRFKQLPTLNSGQQNFLNNLLSNLQGMGSQGGAYSGAQDYLQNMISGSPEAFNRFAAPFKTEFEQQTIPRLAEQFAGTLGPMGGLGSSSGFAQALGGAGTQFQSNLSNLYAQLQQQAVQQALGQYNTLANLGLGTKTFENVYQPGSTGFLGQALGGLLGGLGGGFGLGAGSGLVQGIFGKKPKPAGTPTG